MFYEFQVLHKTSPKLNSVHVPNNERKQLMAKTVLQLLERLFFPGHRNRSIIALANLFFQGQV